MISPDSGLADPLLGSGSGVSECSLLPQSTIYNFSCGHFSKPLFTASDDSEEPLARREERERFALEHIAKCQHSCMPFNLFVFCSFYTILMPVFTLELIDFSLSLLAVSKLNNDSQIASWDTRFETGTRTALLQSFSPIVIAADENERIRYVISVLMDFKAVSSSFECLNDLR